MTVYEHRVLKCSPHRSEAVARHILDHGRPAVEATGGRLFGVFTPQIGLSVNHAVVIVEWSDAEHAARDGERILDGLAGVTSERHELWKPTSRPAPGGAPPDTPGIFSHRWFDCTEEDWPRFLELSETAWGNFEDVHDTRVVGFWRSGTPPVQGQIRVWLMAWYRDLATWDRSRFWNRDPDPGAQAAHDRFRARRLITRDTAVSILGRVI